MGCPDERAEQQRLARLQQEQQEQVHLAYWARVRIQQAIEDLSRLPEHHQDAELAGQLREAGRRVLETAGRLREEFNFRWGRALPEWVP